MTTVAGRRVRLPLPRRKQPVPDGRMTLMEHLRELRSRIVKSVLALAVTTLACLIFAYEPLQRLITRPYCAVDPSRRFNPEGPDTCQLITTGPLDGFSFRIKVGLIAGLVLAAPVILYQLWSFVTPGLHRHERRYAIGFVAGSTVLFAAGTALAYLVLGTSLNVLLGFGGDGLTALLTADKYLSFVLGLLLVFGLAFEFPLLVVMLNFAGVLSSDRLRSWRRVALFACFLFAGIATPSQDPFSMLALAVPLCLLYEASIVVARLHDRAVRKREAASPYAGLADDETSALELDDHADLARADVT